MIMKNKLKRVAIIASGVIILLLLVTQFTAAQVAPSTSIPTTAMASSGQDLTDPAELEAFLDAFFAEKMEDLNIPGAAFVMVKDGEVFLSKGYGYADLENQTPVDPERTIFRTGSVSKLFTWTAAMQQVEQGSIDLNTDVNQYLKSFQLPATYPEPVTLAHLLTHTAGFEDRWIDQKTFNEDEVMQFGQFMAANIPDRVIVPGSVHSYSSYGTNLAGYMVEQVSGMSFAEYIDENIFQPLGMSRSTFRQPVPESMASDLAVGYWYRGDAYEAAPFIYAQGAPAAGISTTATDMAAFMIAHLQDGRYQTTRILEEATSRQMQQQQFTHHPELPGMTYGFKERYINGQRVIGHGGDIHTYASQMILLPEQNEGFFVVYNRFSDAFREDLISAFFARYYPPQTEAMAPEALPMTQEELSRFAGNYRWVRYPRSTLGKLIAFIPGPHNVSIQPNDDSSLSVTFFGSKTEWRYVPVEPLVFKQVSGGLQSIGGLQIDLGDTLVFREDEGGRITYGFVPLQNSAFEKLAWYEGPEAMLGSFGVFLMIFLTPFIFWPLGRLVRRIRKRSPAATVVSKRTRWLAGIVSGLNFIFLAGLLLTFGEELVFGVSPIVLGLLAVPIITSLLTFVLLVMVYPAWKNGYWSIMGRVHYSLITLAAVVFIIWANYWNLLGFHF